MSDKAADGKAADTNIESKHVMFLKVRQTQVDIFLDRLQVDVTRTIVVMIGWKNQSIRVTLWGGLGDVLIEKKTKHVSMCPVVVSKHAHKLYLSSSSSAMIFDDAEIPALKTLSLYENSGVNSKNPSLHVDLSQPKKGTLENLLMGATRKLGQWWCDAFNTTIDYPVLRYRLELDESDDTRHTVVVLFDEPTTTLVKCSTESIDEA
nr:hypothetical protein [Tanacetum cinerariifolium]